MLSCYNFIVICKWCACRLSNKLTYCPKLLVSEHFSAFIRGLSLFCWVKCYVQNSTINNNQLFLFLVHTQRAEQVTLFCRRQVEYSDDEEPKPSVRLSQAQKLRKVIIELVDTERSYVKVNMNDIQKLFFRRKKKQTTKTKN